MLCQSRIADRERKTAFQPSKRKLNPTAKSSVIHGGLSLRPDPVIEGMVDTLNSKFRTREVSNSQMFILNSKSKLPKSLKSENEINWVKSFNKSEENKLRSLNTYYSHNVLGKENIYIWGKGYSVPNSISYNEIAQVITIDIGAVKNLSDLCSDYKNTSAVYKAPVEFILRLAEFYLFVNEKRLEKLKSF